MSSKVKIRSLKNFEALYVTIRNAVNVLVMFDDPTSILQPKDMPKRLRY